MKNPEVKITNDPIVGRAAASCRYEVEFKQLTPEKNCMVFADKPTMERYSQALDKWAAKHAPKGTVVRTTSRYQADGLPRLWLVFPEPAKTNIRGNFPS